MATIKVKFRPSAVAEREGAIYYQIIHERRVRQLLTQYRVMPEEWDGCRMTVRVVADSVRRRHVMAVREMVRCDMERLVRIVRRLDDEGLGYTADNVVEEFRRYGEEYSLSSYMEDMIRRLRGNGKIRTSETYRSALLSFRKFLCESQVDGCMDGGRDIMLDSLNKEVMEAYEAWHRNRGVMPNTISFYMRILRAVYNRAVEAEIIENRYPFRYVYTGIDRTVKRALPLSVIRRIKGLDLSGMPGLDYARDMFIMSFILRGMSFVDMAYLRKCNLRDGYVTYRRRKTGQLLTIKWTREMQIILDKYRENASDFLLPIIRRGDVNERVAYRNAGYSINRSLKRVGRLAGLEIPLTLYVARHSWASAAKAKGVPVGVISEGLGHDNEATPRIFLASLDTSAVDRANALILRGLVQ